MTSFPRFFLSGSSVIFSPCRLRSSHSLVSRWERERAWGIECWKFLWLIWIQFSSVQFSPSVMSDSLRPHGLQDARLPCLSPAPGACSNSCPLSQWCHPTISSCHPLLLPPSVIPSIRVFSNESVLHIMWPKDWSFSFSIHPSNEYSGLISSRMDWLDLLAVQRTLKSLLHHHSSKVSILQHSAFFI